VYKKNKNKKTDEWIVGEWRWWWWWVSARKKRKKSETDDLVDVLSRVRLPYPAWTGCELGYVPEQKPPEADAKKGC